MYHACDQNENEFIRDLSINTTPAELEAHLDYLSRHYKIVELAELLETKPTQPTAAITFDDGFRSVHDNAWRLLKRKQVSARCYLTTEVIGNGKLIWLNELNWFIHTQPQVAREVISAWLSRPLDCAPARICGLVMARYDPESVADLLERLRARTGAGGSALARECRLFLDWDQVARMSKEGIKFGNHTHSHPVLAKLDPEACREEIDRARQALAHLEGAGNSLAYPFGSRSDLTRRIAIEMGVETLLEVDGVNSPLDPERIGRIKVGSDSVATLFAKMEVVEPVKSLLKRALHRLRL